MQDTILSVSDCIALINQTLDYAYPVIVIEGEVASFKVSRDKYVFFDIKDEVSALGCFMTVYQLRLPLEDGMKVRLVAQPKLTNWGKFSLTIREIRPVGEGSIKRSSDLLKQKLAAEGLFDESRKRPLPYMPERIGLIASIESAGYADFCKIMNERWRGIEVLVANVQVQGEGAADQIIRAVNYFNQLPEPVEVLVLIRGGGSAEDLAVFNEEPLVRSIAASRTPTLVGVGHEIDTSLCDLASDLRAATPSNAAQLVVPDRSAVLSDMVHRLLYATSKVEREKSRANEAVIQVADKLGKTLDNRLKYETQRVHGLITVLRQLNPRLALSRGYAMVWDKNGRLIKGGTAILPGDILSIELERAIIKAGVTHVRKK